jgi:hypothetical protein
MLGEHADELVLPLAIALAGTVTSCVYVYLATKLMYRTMIIRQSRLTSLDDLIGWLLILIITVSPTTAQAKKEATGFGGQVAAVKALHTLSGGTIVVFAFFQVSLCHTA